MDTFHIVILTYDIASSYSDNLLGTCRSFVHARRELIVMRDTPWPQVCLEFRKKKTREHASKTTTWYKKRRVPCPRLLIQPDTGTSSSTAEQPLCTITSIEKPFKVRLLGDDGTAFLSLCIQYDRMADRKTATPH